MKSKLLIYIFTQKLDHMRKIIIILKQCFTWVKDLSFWILVILYKYHSRRTSYEYLRAKCKICFVCNSYLYLLSFENKIVFVICYECGPKRCSEDIILFAATKTHVFKHLLFIGYFLHFVGLFMSMGHAECFIDKSPRCTYKSYVLHLDLLV